jgi:hypothetical protein
VEVTKEGLLYIGGGLFWRRVRQKRLLRWNDYDCTLQMVEGHYMSMYLHSKKECAQRGIERPCSAKGAGVAASLSVCKRVSAPEEFDTFVREVRKNNPKVMIES